MKKRFGVVISTEDIKPSRSDFEVVGAFNAGVCRYNGKVVLLVRVAERVKTAKENHCLIPYYDDTNKKIEILEFDKSDKRGDFSDPRIFSWDGYRYITTMSHLRLATSSDGINFEIAEKPTISANSRYTEFGIEDSRITQIEDTYYIQYSSCSKDSGIVVNLASTKDFVAFEYHGVIFHPDNKDVAIFPQKINGKYYALHRPSTTEFGKPSMWIATSPDLVSWGNHKIIASPREDIWDCGRVGASAVPFLTEYGWIEIYHGATVDHKYCIGAMLLDKEDPSIVLARSNEPLMIPETEYEKSGFFSNVIFPCGALYEDNKVKLYYGAADTTTAYAEIDFEDILISLGYETEKKYMVAMANCI